MTEVLWYQEGGEVMEIVKKLVFYKPWNEETKKHLLKELGDTFWYMSKSLIVTSDTSLDEIVAMNVEKLEKR